MDPKNSDSSGLLFKSQKFNLSKEEYYLDYFFEWITGEMNFEGSFYNYWNALQCSIYKKRNHIYITYNTSHLIYMTGIKVHVLLVSKLIDRNQTVRHSIAT